MENLEVTSNTLEVETETWSDPGDYPNAVASAPLPNHDHVSCVAGRVIVKCDPAYLWGLIQGEGFDDELLDLLNDEALSGVEVTYWLLVLDGFTIEAYVDRYDGDNYEPPEPDWDSMPGGHDE